MKKIVFLLTLFLTLGLIACASGQGTASTTAAGDDSAGSTTASDGNKRGNAEYNISGAYQIEEPAAAANITTLPGTDGLAMQIKTLVTGERAPAIIYLENWPTEPGSYDLSDLSLDDPQPGIYEAGVDIKDDASSSVYPYRQFGENVSGTIIIAGVENNQISGSFTFSAETDGESVTVEGAFQNANLP